MLDTYQFIKYNSATSPESFRKKGETGIIVCLDLEDSMFNWIDGTDSNALKIESRKAIELILRQLKSESIMTKIGIRINSNHSGIQHLDIESFPVNSNIHTILIPKVEEKYDIDSVAESLRSRNIFFNEIIPIIESRKGLENLEDIINSEYPVSKVGFGHCDYNLSIGALPFLHQDSVEYWKWAYRIIEILRPHRIKFINSAFLRLNELDFFQSMLSHLHLIYGNNFGQFTMTHQQSILCRTFMKQAVSLEDIAKNRTELILDKLTLTTAIAAFERENNGKGFSINQEHRILMSPQEYCSAKQKLAGWKERDINFTFVGGCFPVQGDILFEDIFHQTLKKKVENKFNVNFNINIIRYENLLNCLDKVINKSDEIKPDYLVFHIRPEPFLRLLKFYYKYLDRNGKLCRSLNLPFFRISGPEMHDLVMTTNRHKYKSNFNQSRIYKSLINLNYLAGYLFGNFNYAANKYLEVTSELFKFSANKNINIIILGPAIRANTSLESMFSGNFSNFISGSFSKKKLIFVSGTQKQNINGKPYFNKNGIHATVYYHDQIAARLFEIIEKDLYNDADLLPESFIEQESKYTNQIICW